MTQNVVGFWHGRPLSYLRRVCLASQVKQGYNVTLFSYEPLANLPRGVVNGDAASIMPLTFKDKLQRVLTRPDIRFRSTIQLSDLFRMCLQKMNLGVWLDTDMYLLRPMSIEGGVPYFAWESFFNIGNSVLYLPATHPILDFYVRLMMQEELIPSWMPLPYRIKLLYWRLSGVEFTPSDLMLSLFGPVMLTALARRTGALGFALPRRTFYSVHDKPALFFDRSGFAPIYDDAEVLGLHISPKAREDDLPNPGSLFEWAARHVDVGLQT